MPAWYKKLTRPDWRWVDDLTETQWDSLRALVVIAGIGLVAAAAYFLGLPVWRRWQNRQSLREAEVFVERRDYPSLMLALRRAVVLAPGDITTWREASRLLSEIGSPETLVAREQLSRIAPQDMALRLALAEDALKFGRIDKAEAALAGLDSAARQDVAFHRLAAALAMSLGRTGDLERELKAILAAAPGNLDARFTYAALRFWQPDPAESAAGEADLEKLVFEPSIRIRVAVELLSSSSRLGSPGKVSDVLLLLLSQFAPKAAPDFSSPRVPAWDSLVDGMKAASLSSPTDAALMARWLASIGRWQEALSWFDSAPAAVRGAPIVADIAAEISAEHDDIPRLARLLRNGAWGDWPASAQVLATASRVQMLHFSEARGHQTWTDAIEACGDSTAGLRALARLASGWRYYDGEEDVLERILLKDPKTFWAYAALRTLYLQRGELQRLWALYDAWSIQLPDDPSIASAGMMLGSVLGRTDPPTLSRAAALRSRFPESLPAQVAYAASLWRLNEADKAWPVLAALSPAVLERRDVSFWEALVQADLGRRSEALAAIARARPGATFAEEQALLRAASAKVGGGS